MKQKTEQLEDSMAEDNLLKMNIEILTKLSEKRLEKISGFDLEEGKRIISGEIDLISSLAVNEDKIARIKTRYGFIENNILHLAAKFGDETSTARILDILSELPDEMLEVVNSRNHGLFTPLHFAAHSGNELVAEALIAGGAENNPQASIENRRWTPIHYAAKYGHAEVVKVLIDSGVDKEAVTGFGLTPLIVGAEFGKISVVEMMISLKANLNARTIEDNHRMNALHYAAIGNFLDIGKILLESGIDRKQKTSSNMSVIELAIESDNSEFVGLMLSWDMSGIESAKIQAKESKAEKSLKKILDYIELKQNFFSEKFLRSYRDFLLQTLKTCNKSNLSLINLSPNKETPLNIFGLISAKREFGFFNKREESFTKFCELNGFNEIAAQLNSLAAPIK